MRWRAAKGASHVANMEEAVVPDACSLAFGSTADGLTPVMFVKLTS